MISPALADRLLTGCLTLFAAALVLPEFVSSWFLALCGVVRLLAGGWKSGLSRLRQNPAMLAFLLLYVLHLVGLLYTENQGKGQAEAFEYKLALLVVPLVLGTWPRALPGVFERCGKIFGYAVALAVAVAFAKGVAIWWGDQETSLTAQITYEVLGNHINFQPIYLAFYCACAIFFLAFNTFLKANFQWRIAGASSKLFGALSIAVCFVGLIMLSSRMEILAFFFALGCLALYFALTRKRWLAPLVILLIPAALTLGLILLNETNAARFGEMVDLQADYTENQWGGRAFRVELWKNAVETWRKSPVLGVGTGDVADALYETYVANDFMLAANSRYNPHNQYLHFLVMLGPLALLALCLALGWLIWRLYPIAHPARMAFALVVVTSLLTESMFERHRGLLFIVVFSWLALQDLNEMKLRAAQRLRD